ncbi:excalibur calcium-binding domain-containing protein [Comamonas fluminis]|uniref:excalibur calcium-binding domain-containing protein n=1 Tax=Comamonas fluminis TaxID=2796366 RepID=UPI001FE82BB5|nr:excalibur calcium-binding domain-containing protein [Comamonas fluminis]
MFRLIIYALIAVGAWKAYTTYQTRQQQAAAIQLLSEPRPRDIDVGRSVAPTKPKYQCDGRTHCSQMTSCEEATFFLRNCPGTKMDGDNDGIPCERQLC